MIDFTREPDPNLLYLVAIFSIEPTNETASLQGSLGRVGNDGDLLWHVEVIQAKRERDFLSRGAALAVVYLRIEEYEWPNVVRQVDVDAASDLLQSLIAPKELEAERALHLNVLTAGTYRGSGRALGGSVYANTTWNVGSGSLGYGRFDWELFDHHPALRLAVRFFTRGVAAARERFFPDACINYARCMESLVGSTSDRASLRRECTRLEIDPTAVEQFLDSTRNTYSIAHALDKVQPGRTPKLKKFPGEDVERHARAISRQLIEAYIQRLPRPDPTVEAATGIRYAGLPPVPTNLPLPLEALWVHQGPWGQAAPGLEPDWIPVEKAAASAGVRGSLLKTLIEKRVLDGVDRAGSVVVPSTRLEFLLRLLRERGSDYQSRLSLGVELAARALGTTVSRVQQLSATRQIGPLEDSPFGGLHVDTRSLSYHAWRKRRARVVRRLRLPERFSLRKLARK